MRVKHPIIILLLALSLSACGRGADRQALRQEALSSREAGNYEAAAELFGRALEASGGRAGEAEIDLLRYKADCEFMAGRFEAAARSYDALLLLEEAEDSLRFYRERKGYIDGCGVLQRAADVMQEGNYPEALDMLAPLTERDDDIAKTALFNQAVCCEYMHDFEKALRLFEEYLERWPGDEAAEKEATFLRSRR